MRDLTKPTHGVKNFSEKPPTSNYEVKVKGKENTQKLEIAKEKKEKVQLSKESQVELQKIDCNCNDCFFLERDIAQTNTQKGKAAPIFEGNCKKFEKRVSFMPGVCQLHTQECFLHRKEAPKIET